MQYVLMMDVNEDIITVVYTYENEEYSVTESHEIHVKLQTDEIYCAEYFANVTKNTAESHINDTNIDNTCIDDTNIDDTNIDDTNIDDTNIDNTCIDNNNDNDNNLKVQWDRKLTKIVLAKYLERLPQFRNPKMKKSRLWREMEIEIKALGYTKIDAHSIDQKIRNMKSTYKRIKNNNKKTGRGREDWEFYNEVDEIFNTDKSVNFDEGISSMDGGQNSTCEAIDFSKRRLSLPTSTLSFKRLNDIYNFKIFSNYIHYVSSYYDPFSDSDLESSMEIPSTSSDNMPHDEPYSFISNDETCSHDTSTRDSNEGISLKRKKLYSQRNKVIELEIKKMKILENIQKKRESTNIDKQLERVANAIEEKNEIAKKKNDLLEKRNELLLLLLQSNDKNALSK